jgi:hypothetical protein
VVEHRLDRDVRRRCDVGDGHRVEAPLGEELLRGPPDVLARLCLFRARRSVTSPTV